MRRAISSVCSLILGLGLLPLAVAAETVRTAPADGRPSAVAGETLDSADRVSSTADDREELVLTIYQNAPALVRDRRQIGLSDEPLSLHVLDVSDRMLGASLRLGGEAELRLHAVRRPEPLERQRLLRSLVGQTVSVRPGEAIDGETREARLVSLVDGDPLVSIDESLEIIDARSPWRLVLPADAGIMQRTEGLWIDLESELAGRQGVEFLYQTQGLAWQADYVLDLESDVLRMQAFASLENRTALDFDAARIRLLAGDPQTEAPMQRREMLASDAVGVSAEGPYQLFTLPRRVTLPAGENLQVPLFPLLEAEFERQYRVEGHAGGRSVGEQRVPVSLHLSFVTPDDDDQAWPFPAGAARVYQQDSEEEPLFLGQDRIPASSPGSEVELRLGTVFDVTATRTQREFRRLGEREDEQAWTVALRNAGDEDATVEVIERIPGQWTMLEESSDHRRPASDRAVWRLTVPAGGDKELHYRVQIRH
ncbi:DUF4139 domain-containing protein [Methylonatrum kenyense]|uniref:DUF4139 domain-containing protein n=1 Tax=Methylonatrum kenyense TaxID=455253 RepID=UPI0020C07108|nr:DUF4139 domain-containing protein [Methylonatrum kenyense]MCK8515474.1 DUF4139 domain-containing protein [Methylonatrum kenyense]